MKNDRIPMIQIDDTIISIDCLSEKFCCDLDACKGECCIEGDAGAPVELDEVAELEEALPVVWPWLSASAQAVIDRQGVIVCGCDTRANLLRLTQPDEAAHALRATRERWLGAVSRLWMTTPDADMNR